MPRPTKYPYAEWAEAIENGKDISLFQGKDFYSSVDNFAWAIRRYFRVHNLPNISVSVDHNRGLAVIYPYTPRGKFSRPLGNKYPWHDWLNGKPNVLVYGVDYTCNSETLRRQATQMYDRSKPYTFRNYTTHTFIQGTIRSDLPLVKHASTLFRNRNQGGRIK